MKPGGVAIFIFFGSKPYRIFMRKSAIVCTGFRRTHHLVLRAHAMTSVHARISPLDAAGRQIGHHRAANVRRILDLGCGDGGRCVALAAHNFNHVTGVDSSESLLFLARKRAARRNVTVEFVHADPRTTPFNFLSFDEVLLLGSLFGHGQTARSDVELLLEALRVLQPGGTLRLSFADGDWLRESLKPVSVESLPRGFLHRHRTLEENGHCLRTRTMGADEEIGLSLQQTTLEWLYSPREVADLLRRLGFQSITYDSQTGSAGCKDGFLRSTPIHVVHCLAPSEHLRGTVLTPRGYEG
jgi:SAM-dependent methyltransferase